MDDAILADDDRTKGLPVFGKSSSQASQPTFYNLLARESSRGSEARGRRLLIHGLCLDSSWDSLRDGRRPL